MKRQPASRAKTIHRLLEVDPKGGGFKRGEDNPARLRPVVVDEILAMVDVMLMQALMKAVPDKAALLLVGESTSFLRSDQAKHDPHNLIRRRACGAPHRSIPAAHEPHHHQRPSHQPGRSPDLSPPDVESDFYFVQADDPDSAVGGIIELVKTRIPPARLELSIRDIQVLCPMNRGGVGARVRTRTSGSTRTCRRSQGGAVRLDLRTRRQGHADRERLRQGGL